MVFVLGRRAGDQRNFCAIRGYRSVIWRAIRVALDEDRGGFVDIRRWIVQGYADLVD
jgi:hypothetical protein